MLEDSFEPNHEGQRHRHGVEAPNDRATTVVSGCDERPGSGTLPSAKPTGFGDAEELLRERCDRAARRAAQRGGFSVRGDGGHEAK